MRAGPPGGAPWGLRNTFQTDPHCFPLRRRASRLRRKLFSDRPLPADGRIFPVGASFIQHVRPEKLRQVFTRLPSLAAFDGPVPATRETALGSGRPIALQSRPTAGGAARGCPGPNPGRTRGCGSLPGRNGSGRRTMTLAVAFPRTADQARESSLWQRRSITDEPIATDGICTRT